MNKNERIKSRNIIVYSSLVRNELPSDNFRRNFLAGSPVNHPSPPGTYRGLQHSFRIAGKAGIFSYHSMARKTERVI